MCETLRTYITKKKNEPNGSKRHWCLTTNVDYSSVRVKKQRTKQQKKSTAHRWFRKKKHQNEHNLLYVISIEVRFCLNCLKDYEVYYFFFCCFQFTQNAE